MLARRAMMEANESLHALSNDVGTTSSGEDLAGIDCRLAAYASLLSA
jgi:hypothetical protein